MSEIFEALRKYNAWSGEPTVLQSYSLTVLLSYSPTILQSYSLKVLPSSRPPINPAR
jgi:hypothetical protein